VLPPVTLDASHATALDAILKRSMETYSAWVRRLIEERA
jgi:hypothetical protein